MAAATATGASASKERSAKTKSERNARLAPDVATARATAERLLVDKAVVPYRAPAEPVHAVGTDVSGRRARRVPDEGG